MKRGFTLIELLIVVSIMLILALASFSLFGNIQTNSQLNESSTQIVQALRTARERSIARYNGSFHGIYFSINPSGQDKYIFYQGVSYAERNVDSDKEVLLDEVLQLSTNDFNLIGNDVDINFSASTGLPNNVGTLILQHRVSGSRSIIINSLGMVSE